MNLGSYVLEERVLVRSPILPYVAMIVGVLEGRRISRDEVLRQLRQSMRQRSIGRQTRREYVLRFLNEHPP